MQDDKQAKQTFLREQILQKQYDPEQFITFMNEKLSIGDNLDLCTFEELQKVVWEFVEMKNPPQEDSYENTKQTRTEESDSLPLHSEVGELKHSVVNKKPKQILFTKYNPNVLEYEYSKSFQCKKIENKFEDVQKDIKCFVSDPERKTTGGFFGIGQTSFLEFKVRIPILKWSVGRRYSDFQWLRAYLLRMYPSQIIPPIPEKKASKRTKRHLEKRMRILEYFLNDIVNIPELMNNKYVQGFLSISDGPRFTSLKADADKIKGFSHFSDCENYEGQANVRLTQENNAYFREMEKLIPKVETIYKQLTRHSKGLQNFFTQEVNSLYEMGNLFAELHENSRDILNKLPKSNGLKKLNDVFITSNNMMIEWGNVLRGQHDFLEKNFNTFFKYIRNELYGYTEVFQKQAAAEQEFAKVRIALDKKKEKIYNLHDVTRWELPSKEAKEVPKQVIHDKVQAYKVMLPKETREMERLRDYAAFYINELHENGNRNFERTFTLFCQNFKELTIKMKVNSQQLCQLWGQMSANFSGTNKKVAYLKEVPVSSKDDEEQMDD